MGLNQSSPIKHAKELSLSFIKMLKEESSDEDLVILLKEADRKFEVWLEDFCVNDEKLQKFKEKDQIACVGTIIYSMSFVDEILKEADINNRWDPLLLCKRYWNQNSMPKIICKFLEEEYHFDGTSYYRYKDGVWFEITESEISLSNVEDKVNLNPRIPQFEIYNGLMAAGRGWITNLFEQLADEIRRFDVSNVFLPYLRLRAKKMNSGASYLPCYSSTVSLDMGSSLKSSPKDLATIRLPYDPVQKVTPLTSKFLGAFGCGRKELATTLMNWARGDTKTLTILSGPGNNGKSTLVKYAQAMLGPFAASGNLDVYPKGVVRTLFLSELDTIEDMTAFEKGVRENTIPNLVYVTNLNLDLGSKFGDRKVKYLVLTEPIANSDPNLLNQVTTRAQLASGLGWCLTNYRAKGLEFLYSSF